MKQKQISIARNSAVHDREAETEANKHIAAVDTENLGSNLLVCKHTSETIGCSIYSFSYHLLIVMLKNLIMHISFLGAMKESMPTPMQQK